MGGPGVQRTLTVVLRLLSRRVLAAIGMVKSVSVSSCRTTVVPGGNGITLLLIVPSLLVPFLLSNLQSTVLSVLLTITVRNALDCNTPSSVLKDGSGMKRMRTVLLRNEFPHVSLDIGTERFAYPSSFRTIVVLNGRGTPQTSIAQHRHLRVPPLNVLLVSRTITGRFASVWSTLTYALMAGSGTSSIPTAQTHPKWKHPNHQLSYQPVLGVTGTVRSV